MTILIGLFILAMLLLCPLGWAVVGRRWFHGTEPVPYEPRRIVPWDGPSTLLIIGLYLGGQIGATVVAKQRYETDTGLALNLDRASEPEFLIHAFTAHAVFNFLLLIVGLGMLMTWNRATIADVGLSVRRFFYDVKLGVGAFVLLVPPVLLVQALLSWLFSPSTHPMLEALRRSQSPQLVFWSIVAAVVTAPIVEEFFFRVVLQGWFERLFANPSQPKPAADVVSESPAIPPPTVEAETPLPETLAPVSVEPAPPRPRFAPILISSVLFALAHLGNGPDPVALFFLAIGIGYLYRQTHRIWPGMVLHFLLNAFSTLVVLFVDVEV